MKARVSFTSGQFPIEPGEDEDINPGVYGKALASYVADRLRERGVPVEGLVEEDFARLVLLHRKPFMLWVGCANDESPAGWQLFLCAEVGLLTRLRGVKPEASFAALKQHVEAIVAAIPNVSNIEWHPQ